MARKKIKLITFDLDDTVWPNQKVIVDAEKALWNFLLMKVPHVRDALNEENINKITQIPNLNEVEGFATKS